MGESPKAATSAAPRYFATPAAFEAWLAKHHATKTELLVGLYKTGAQDRGMGYKDALDAALCWGWIDGVRRSIDDTRWTIRFTPRKARSIWSNVNVKRVKELEAEGRMKPSGRAAFEARDAKRTGVYSFEQPEQSLAPAMAKRLEKEQKAWAYWQKAPPSYKRAVTHWLASAKKEETRERRFTELVACSKRGEKIGPLRWTKSAPRDAPRQEGR